MNEKKISFLLKEDHKRLQHTFEADLDAGFAVSSVVVSVPADQSKLKASISNNGIHNS